MKVKDMPYSRFDCEEAKKAIAAFTKELGEAKTYEEAKAVFLKMEEADKHWQTMVTLAQVRHSIDTRDKFYEEECNYYNRMLPEVEEYSQQWNLAMLNSPFRADFEKEYGPEMTAVLKGYADTNFNVCD